MKLQTRPKHLGHSVIQTTIHHPTASLLRASKKVYDWLMKTFIASNGREVSETVTESGVTGFIDTSIPTAALEGWRAQLLGRLAYAVREQQADALAEIARLNPKA